ncbi:MAG TPA: tetratricopeptide repeat protein [Candidatus Acidoferrales bacterium]|nr:tetratricopeptide repeat protein [Candidatus Acidoferrales bacterium]
MAQLIERVLVWVAALVTAAALIAVILNLVPGALGGFRWSHANGPTGPTAIDLAEQAIARNDTRTAMALAAKAVAANPNDASIANRAGNVALRAGDAKMAERYYRAGENVDPHYAWNFVALGQLYERQGKEDLADAQLRVATAAAPDQPFIHYDLGVVELEEGLYAAALSDFETELQRSPTYKPAMIGRAEALEKLGRTGEAVALYQRAGVNTHAAGTRPRLTVKPIAAPSPTPAPSPSPTAPVVAVASPSPKTKATRVPIIVIAPSRAPATVAPTTTPVRPPWASPPPTGVVAAGPTQTPLAIVSTDARSYLVDVTQDLGFTRSLPEADPAQSAIALNTKLNFALANRPPDVETMLNVGAAALLSGRMDLASRAFSAASQAAPSDWRGPYYAGLTAQANGDFQQATAEFNTALAREPRAEAYTSLAVVELQGGDFASAAANADKASQINPSYEPGRFVAGMVALVEANLPDARNNLEAAQVLGGAPSRTAYFLAAVTPKS